MYCNWIYTRWNEVKLDLEIGMPNSAERIQESLFSLFYRW